MQICLHPHQCYLQFCLISIWHLQQIIIQKFTNWHFFIRKKSCFISKYYIFKRYIFTNLWNLEKNYELYILELSLYVLITENIYFFPFLLLWIWYCQHYFINKNWLSQNFFCPRRNIYSQIIYVLHQHFWTLFKIFFQKKRQEF